MYELSFKICVNTVIYIAFDVENNDKLQSVIMLEYQKNKNIFAEGYTSSWSKEDFPIKNVRNIVSRRHVIEDLHGKEIIETLYKK